MNNRKSEPSLFFAALRRTNLNGTKVLVLVDPMSGKCFEENEETLKDAPCDIVLGDFLHVITNEESNEYSKTTVPHNWKVQVLKDVAFVNNMKSKLHNEDGRKVFRNSFFSDQLYQGAVCSMWRGTHYRVRIRLLSMPHKISSSTVLHFEATKPQIIYLPKRFEPSKPLPLCQTIHPPMSRTIFSCSSTYLPPVPGTHKKKKKTSTTKALIKLLSPQSSLTYLSLPPGAKRVLSMVNIAKVSLESLNNKFLNYLANKSRRLSKKKIQNQKSIQPKKAPVAKKSIIQKAQKLPVP